MAEWYRKRMLAAPVLMAMGVVLAWLWQSSSTAILSGAHDPATGPRHVEDRQAKPAPRSRVSIQADRASSTASPASLLQSAQHPVFQPNRGQFAPEVRFAATTRHDQTYLENDGLTLVQMQGDRAQSTTMRFIGGQASPSEMEGLQRTPTVHHYYSGSTRIENVPTYQRVRYYSLYPGIDAEFYSRNGRIEYDFNVAAGADPQQIALRFKGYDEARLDKNGDLLLQTPFGLLRQQAPVSYQRVDGQKVPVQSRYRLRSTNQGVEVRIELGTYRHDLPLVIDPVLVYGTFLGGNGNDSVNDMAIYDDTTNNRSVVYLTGEVASVSFPSPNGNATTPTILPAGATLGGGSKDVFVTAIDTSATSGNQMLFVTHIVGNGDDIPHALSVDGNGNVYIGGETKSSDLPASTIAAAGVYQAQNNSVAGTLDGFVAELNSSGTLQFLTYFGGDGDEIIHGLDTRDVTDANGNILKTEIVIAGMTRTDNGNLTGGSNPFPTHGSNPTIVSFSSPADPDPKKFLQNNSGGTPTPTTFDGTQYIGGCTQGFVARLKGDGTAVEYSSYLGGEGQGNTSNLCTTFSPVPNQGDYDTALDVAVDASGRAYVTGQTISPVMFPITKGAYATRCGAGTGVASGTSTNSTCDFSSGGKADVFVTVISADGTTVDYSSYLGGNGQDIAYGIDVKDDGSMVFLTGSTLSVDTSNASSPTKAFPTTLAPRQAIKNNLNDTNNFNPLSDAFLAALKPDTGLAQTDQLFYSTYYGAPDARDTGRDVFYDTAAGLVWITGETQGSLGVNRQVLFAGTQEPALSATSRPADAQNNLFDQGFVAQIDMLQNGQAGVKFAALVSGYDTSTGQAGTIMNAAANDQSRAIAVDQRGRILVAGSTQSEAVQRIITIGQNTQTVYDGFPVTVGAIQTECGDFAAGRVDDCNGGNGGAPTSDGFLVELSPESDLVVTLKAPRPHLPNANPPAPSVIGNGVQFDYVFDVTNNGPEVARNVVLTATINGTSTATGTTFSYNLAGGGTNTQQGGATGCKQAAGSNNPATITCTIPVIAANATRQISFTGAASVGTTGAPLGTAIIDASVTSDSVDNDLTNNSITPRTNPIEQVATFDASVTMTPDRTTAIGGQQVHYTVTVTNDQNSQISTGPLKVNLPLTPTTDIGFVSATPLASTPAAGACAVANPGTGQDCQMSSLLPGESASWDLVIIARPIGNAPQFTIGGATVLSTSSTPSRDSNPNNNTTSYTDAQGNQFINQPINVQAGADLLLDVNTVNLGGNRFRFDLTLTNNGPSQAENVKLEGFLPAQLDNPSPKLAGSDCQAAPHGSALAPNGQAFIRCTFNKSLGGPMAPNTSLLWYVDVAGVAGSSGPVDFSLSFTSTTADPNPGNNVNISRRVNLGGGGFTQTGGGALNVWTLAVLMLGLFSATIWSSRQ